MSDELQVGISDLLAHRDCPRRASYGARRHIGRGEQDHQSGTPEAQSPAAGYGSCLHDVLQLVEDGWTDDAAIEQAWATWGSLLAVEDIDLLRDDLEVYRQRDPQNVRTVLAEGELRTFLCKLADGRDVYFRARIDRLYERLDRPGAFVMVDYKTSKWEKGQEDVDEDEQMWSYNWIIHEVYPEVDELDQVYDQFRHGQVHTSKSEKQRRQIKTWLTIQARNYFGDDDVQADGLLKPRFNNWCAWCPILADCAIIPRLSSWALSRIRLLGAELPAAQEEITPDIGELLEPFVSVQTALKTLKAYEDRVKELVREMPDADRGRLGFKTYTRHNTVFTAEALERMHAEMGPAFFTLVKASKGRLDTIGDEQLKEWALALGERTPGAVVVTKRK